MASMEETINSTIPSILDRLKSGIKNAIEDSTPKNITLVLGLSGSQKRDLVQFISGNEQLNSLDDFTASSTAFPGLIVDSKKNTAFYEYPKFGESKTVEEEISAILLLNKIVEYADSIKLIFVVPESQNRFGLDDEHIDSLIDDSVKIIENFDEVKDSIALVVTKVDNFIDDEGDSVSDEDVIESIADSLTDNLKKYSRSNELSFTKKQNLINILLRKKDEMYTNIGIYKKPRIFRGKVSENDILQDNERSLEMLINVNTKFTIHDKNNFQCASCLDKLMNDLQSGLSKNVEKIKQIIVKYFENLSIKSEDLDELNMRYTSGYQLFNDLNEICMNYNSIKDYLNIFIELKKETEFDIQIPKEITQDLNTYADYMGLFLQMPAFKSTKYSNFATIDKAHFSILLTEIKEYLAKSQLWYTAVAALRDNWSTHEMYEAIKQEYIKEIEKLYTIADPAACHNIGKMDEREQKKAYANIINDIIKIISPTDKERLVFRAVGATSIMKEADLRQSCETKLKVLSKMLNTRFLSSSDNMRNSTSADIFTMKAQFLKLSDFSKLISDKAPDDVKEIRLFASDRIYIDADLHLTGDEVRQLSIIAPTWEVVGNRQIVWVGKPGENPNSLIAPSTPNIPGHNGTDGQPGNPGGPTGNFLGIGSFFINGENLNISVIGGTGGPGQKGGNGVDGTFAIPENEDLAVETDSKGHAKIDVLSRKCNCFDYEKDPSGPTMWKKFQCTDERFTCKNGGNGGRGGAGGKGGVPGERKLIDVLYNTTSIVGESAEGLAGTDGTPGIPAKHGEGKVLEFNVTLNWHMPEQRIVYDSKYKIDGERVRGPLQSCENGNINKTLNSDDIKPPKASGVRLSANAINDYKGYLRHVLVGEDEEVRAKLLTDFMNSIEKNELVKELYHAKEFADELKSLESQFHELHKNLSFLPFYQSLLNRITEYADSYHSKHMETDYTGKRRAVDDDENKTLRYLYAATSSKIFSIRDKRSTGLIIDIEEYLNTALANIDTLNDYKKIHLVNKAQKKYYNSLHENIAKAQKFCSQIGDEIKAYFRNLDGQIELLIAETESLEQKVETQKAKLDKMNEKIKKAILLRSFFAIPKLIGAFLSFAGPVGTAAGAALAGSVMVIESLSVKDVDKDNIKAAKLPVVFDREMKTMKRWLEEGKRETFMAQLDAIVETFNTTELSAPPQSMPELKNTISNITSVVAKLKEEAKAAKLKEEKEAAKLKEAEEEEGINIPDKLSESMGKLTELLEKQAEELGDDKYKDDKRVQAWSKRMDRAVKILKIVEVPVSLIKDIVADNAKSDLIARAYKDSEEQLKKLEVHKKIILDNIAPKLKAFQNHINTNLGAGNLTRKTSLVGLDVSQWKMKDILIDLKDRLHQITQGFEVQEDMTHLLEKIDRALSTMTDIYRDIEEYREKKELADYIKNLNPTSSDTEVIGDPELKNAIDDIKVIIQSNIVLEEYERVINAVKQTVYPLAPYFLDKNQFVPIANADARNVTSFVIEAEKHLIEIRRKHRANRATIDEIDGIKMLNKTFTGGDDLRAPFYTWKYAENKKAISQLLRGKKVTLKADITKGIGLSAIKFRKIGIKFKFPNNATAEKAFKNNLKYFTLNMHHLGNSQYQCNDKFHTITSPQVNLLIEFTSAEGNGAFKKLNDNEASLSPYTSWDLQLNSSAIIKRSFKRLIRFENMTIDLELEGSADYLLNNHDRSPSLIAIEDICNGNLSKYYNEDTTLTAPIDLYEEEDSNEISDYDIPTNNDEESYSRKRRSLGDRDFEQDLEENLFSTSGACSNMKSSFINNIFNLIGTGLVAYEYLNPVNKITQWFGKYEASIDQEDSFVLDSDLPTSSMKMLNVQYPATESPKISKMFIDDDLPTANNLLNDASFCNHGNLLLLDLVIRSKSGVKYSHPSFAANANVDPKYAQHLAYGGHHM